MFGKIKGKLQGVFSKGTDEVFDEDEVVEEENKEEIPKPPKEDEELDETEEEQPKKKGFLSKVFGKKDKDEEEEDEAEEIQDEVLEDVEESEKEEIKSGKEVDKKTTKKQKEKLEKSIEKEEKQEKEELKEIPKPVKKEAPKPKKKEPPKEIEEPIPEPPKEEPIENIPEPQEVEEEKEEEKEEPKEKKQGFFGKTFGKLTKKKLSHDDFDKIWTELEIFLLEINIAYEIVEKIETHLKESLIDSSFDRFSLAKKIREILIEEVSSVMKDREADLLEDIHQIRKEGEVVKILVLGVNGTGKTTSIAKFVHFLQKNNLKVVVAAADTFRAAAVEQLDEHAQKVGFKLIKHKGGSDPAAVAFDAIEHAKAKQVDVVLIDTAGRMPNNSNLMQELAKIERVAKSQINLFIGDSVSGNDLLEQIDLFDKVVGITGMILTKTDTDERPGSVVTAAYSIEKPIYYLGIGQGYDDLVKFDSKLVAEKLFEIDEE